MFKKQKDKKIDETRRRDWFDYVSLSIGSAGFLLALGSFFNSCDQEKRNQHWSCINDTKHYPVAYLITGKVVTENLFKWKVTPEISRQRNLQQSIRIFLSQLEESKADINKHNCTIQSLDNFLTKLREIDLLVSKSQFNKIDVDDYSTLLEILKKEKPFSEQCCSK